MDIVKASIFGIAVLEKIFGEIEFVFVPKTRRLGEVAVNQDVDEEAPHLFGMFATDRVVHSHVILLVVLD